MSPGVPRNRRCDGYWASATWSVPVAFPLVVAALALMVWAIGRMSSIDERTSLLVVAAASSVSVGVAAIAAALTTRGSARLRGAALGLGCVSAFVWVCAIVFAVSADRW